MDRSRNDRLGLLIVLAVAAVARLATLLALRGDLAIRVPLSDAEHYLSVAKQLAEGGGWPPGPHFMGPVYPFLLSGLFRLFPADVETVQWAQFVIGIVTTGVVYHLARRIDVRAAMPAGLLYAVCGPAIVFENQVLMEATLAFATIASIDLLAGEMKWKTIRLGLSGLLLGIAAAGRPVFALLLPIFVIIIWRNSPRLPSRDRAIVPFVIAFLAIVVPPSLHNIRETGQPSFVSVNGGLNLYIGNHPQAEGLYSPPPELLFLDQDPTGAQAASRLAGHRLDPAEASTFFQQRAWTYIRANPGRAARLWVRKLGFFFSPDEIPQIESFTEICRRHRLLAVLGLVGFPLLLPLALLGLTATKSAAKERNLLLALLLVGISVHVVFFSTARFRVALLSAMSVLAGIGTVKLIETFSRRGNGWRGLWPIVLGIVLLAVAPRTNRSQAEAWACHQSGIRFERIDAVRAAEEMYRRAVELEPDLGESWHNLAAAKAREGRIAEAIEDYETALPLLRNHPLTLYNLAILYGRLSMDERALEYFDRSVAADSTNLAVHVDRGIALYRLARTEEAFAEWRRVARESPHEPSLQRTLARLAELGVELPNDLSRTVRTP